jgi:Dolichyl-phosphate-mannose-protein mannosyltransferase
MTSTTPSTAGVYRWATAALFAAALAVVFLTFRDYGVTWDEHYHDTYGKYLLAYYLSGFHDTAALTYHNLWLYGGAFDAPTALMKRLLPFGDYETQHLMIALSGLLGVFGCYRIGETLSGPRAGFWSAVLLLATPVWYGHMFNNPKDIPFAAGMTWALYYTIRAAPLLPNVPAGLVIKLGLTLGLAFGIRIAAVFAVINLAAPGLAWLVVRATEAGAAQMLRDSGRALLRAVLPAAVVGYLVMLAAWPWAQHGPLVRPFEATWIFSHSPWDIDTLFLGRLVNSLHIPAGYMAVYFSVETPELILALLALAAGLALTWLYHSRGRQPWPVYAGYFTLAFATLFPFVFFVLFRPVAYDRIRHFMFVFPCVAAVAGLALDWLFAQASARGAVWRGALSTAVVAYLAWHAGIMVSLHPDEYIYYNQLTGGVKGAQGRFELDYWGNSYREAVNRLEAYVQDEERRTGDHKTYQVMVCAEGSSAAYFFPKNLVLAHNEREADFYISVTRLGCDREYDGDTITTVARDGATLSVIKDRRRLRELAPERLEEHAVPGAMVEADHPGLAPSTDPIP